MRDLETKKRVTKLYTYNPMLYISISSPPNQKLLSFITSFGAKSLTGVTIRKLHHVIFDQIADPRKYYSITFTSFLRYHEFIRQQNAHTAHLHVYNDGMTLDNRFMCENGLKLFAVYDEHQLLDVLEGRSDLTPIINENCFFQAEIGVTDGVDIYRKDLYSHILLESGENDPSLDEIDILYTFGSQHKALCAKAKVECLVVNSTQLMEMFGFPYSPSLMHLWMVFEDGIPCERPNGKDLLKLGYDYLNHCGFIDIFQHYSSIIPFAWNVPVSIKNAILEALIYNRVCDINKKAVRDEKNNVLIMFTPYHNPVASYKGGLNKKSNQDRIVTKASPKQSTGWDWTPDSINSQKTSGYYDFVSSIVRLDYSAFYPNILLNNKLDFLTVISNGLIKTKPLRFYKAGPSVCDKKSIEFHDKIFLKERRKTLS